jgi:hypothetical protein
MPLVKDSFSESNIRGAIPFDAVALPEEIQRQFRLAVSSLSLVDRNRWSFLRNAEVEKALATYAQIRAVMYLKAETLRAFIRANKSESPPEAMNALQNIDEIVEQRVRILSAEILYRDYDIYDTTVNLRLVQMIAKAATKLAGFNLRLEEVERSIPMARIDDAHDFYNWITDIAEGAVTGDAMIRARVQRLAWSHRWFKHEGANWVLRPHFDQTANRTVSIEKLSQQRLLTIVDQVIQATSSVAKTVEPVPAHGIDDSGWTRFLASGGQITISQIAWVSAHSSYGLEGILTTTLEVIPINEPMDQRPTGLPNFRVRLVNQTLGTSDPQIRKIK